jgi:isocitrate dehydrogenase kinase/phosphatase
MSTRLTDSRLANLGAATILEAFNYYQAQFQLLTRRAKRRFEACDWRGMQADAAERLDLYRRVVDGAVADLLALLDDRVYDKLVWASLKAVYSGLIDGRDDWEIAETFYNSLTRRIFATVGVDPQIEFVATDFETPPSLASQPIYRTYPRAVSTTALVNQILADYRFQAPFASLERDTVLATGEIEARLRQLGALRAVDRAEMVRSAFYRGMGAYLVGRLYSGSHELPLVLALLQTPQGIAIDSVLLEEDQVSVLLSFARSYFHVDVDRPYDLVHFLKGMLPRKRIAELYISVGYNKHGKTELYRDILHYLAHSDDQFEIARGQRGMVMLVFNMPGYDLVFKVIKDRFQQPKDSTRQEVMGKYDLVFKHDRAGRLVDAQEFEHLAFDSRRFSESLLAELAAEASQTVNVGDRQVVVGHVYVERRVIPLDVFVQEAAGPAVEQAVLDYGQAIKDLAVTNIFPGDLLLKNFGVTRHGRVVFYDYDELCLLTDCRFRRLPPAMTVEDELAAEPWFHVNPNDVFPEEFARFLGLAEPLVELFCRHHGDLFAVTYWRQVQEQLRAGELIHIYPYPQHRRLNSFRH